MPALFEFEKEKSMAEFNGGLTGWIKKSYRSLGSFMGMGGVGFLRREPYPGAWQRNEEVSTEDVLSYSPVFACISLIASDIAKLPINVIGLVLGRVWKIIDEKGLTKLLNKPNQFQNRIQFFENWIISKLSTGNAYIFLRRNSDREVISMHVLDPRLVNVLVADDGSVFYEINADNLMGNSTSIKVPSSEIIHDRFNCFYHPLQGLSPIYACAVASGQGLAIQKSSSQFFANGSRMAGLLTTPDSITQDEADRLKAAWESEYTGANSAGKVAVAGDGLKFEPMAMAASDAQLIEQLKWTAETVCACFHVPAYMIGVGEWPPYTDVQSANQQYYSQALQILLESIELGLDIGLSLDDLTGVEFDVKQLLRMDSKSQADVITRYTGAGLMKIDEGRAEIGREPIAGGDAAYLQQQNYSLSALAKRDARDDLWEKKTAGEPVSNTNNESDASADVADDKSSKSLEDAEFLQFKVISKYRKARA